MRNEPSFDAPIPGENYTSDTRNYPWHRPPEIETYDDAIEYAAKMFKQPRAMDGTRTLLELGITVTTLTNFFLMRSIGLGKYTPDMALVVAGPVAKTIELLAVQMGVDYEMGFEDVDQVPTAQEVQTMLELSGVEDEEEDAVVDEILPEEGMDTAGMEQAGGLMSSGADDVADEDTQRQMLGMTDDEEEEPVDGVQ